MFGKSEGYDVASQPDSGSAANLRGHTRNDSRNTETQVLGQFSCAAGAATRGSSSAHGRGGYPKYIKDEVAAHSRCGLMQHGFARFACRDCGLALG